MTDLTIDEVKSDLSATERDLDRCETIARNIEAFITDNGGENRTMFRVDLMKWQSLADQARELKRKIAAKMDSMLVPFVARERL